MLLGLREAGTYELRDLEEFVESILLENNVDYLVPLPIVVERELLDANRVVSNQIALKNLFLLAILVEFA